MHHGDDHPRRVVVDFANQNLHIGILQLDEGRVIVNRMRNQAFVVQPSLKAIDPQDVIIREGPKGGVNPAQDDGGGHHGDQQFFIHGQGRRGLGDKAMSFAPGDEAAADGDEGAAGQNPFNGQ